MFLGSFFHKFVTILLYMNYWSSHALLKNENEELHMHVGSPIVVYFNSLIVPLLLLTLSLSACNNITLINGWCFGTMTKDVHIIMVNLVQDKASYVGLQHILSLLLHFTLWGDHNLLKHNVNNLVNQSNISFC